MGGRQMDVVPFYRNWSENETTWQLKPKRTAAASRGVLSAARLSCSFSCNILQNRVITMCVSETDDILVHSVSTDSNTQYIILLLRKPYNMKLQNKL